MPFWMEVLELTRLTDRRADRPLIAKIYWDLIASDSAGRGYGKPKGIPGFQQRRKPRTV